MNIQTWYMMTGAARIDAGDQRDLDVERERLARLRVDHLAAGRQHAARRREQEVEDAVDEAEADQRRRRRPPAAQLTMRFRSSSRCSRNDIFPPAGFIVVLGGGHARRPRTGGPGKGTRANYALLSTLS